MPAKNRIKTYQENGYYHIYNRGVAKQPIFLDEQDYKVFLSYLKTYLSPQNNKDLQRQINQAKNWSEKHAIIRLINLKNFSKEIDLLAYCLMPNHLHLLIKQKPATAIKEFIQAIMTKYSTYFNKKYNRVGGIFQGPYKATLVKSDDQLLHLTRYIHQNPNSTRPGLVELLKYRYSSLPNYLGKFKQSWVKAAEILSFFKENHPTLSYKSFVTENQNTNLIQNIILD